eukprot:COSAG05_NODE_1062_length_5993_cov_8.045640_5_plen_90_part_00
MFVRFVRETWDHIYVCLNVGMKPISQRNMQLEVEGHCVLTTHQKEGVPTPSSQNPGIRPTYQWRAHCALVFSCFYLDLYGNSQGAAAMG